MESDLSQQVAMGRNYEEEMQRLKVFFINNMSLIVLDDSYFPNQMLEVLQDTLNCCRMIFTNCKTWLPPNLNLKNDPHPLRLCTD